jgi:DNA-binding CsgD family transcriptional regulator
VHQLSALLGLTTSEAEIASQLLLGDSISEIARARKTAVDTVRGHVKSLLRKTGLPSQKHLVTLLSRVASVYARSASHAA